MANAQGLSAYPTARTLLDQALESERGIKVKFQSYSEAFKFRMNCYTVRSRERKESVKIYPIGHALHGSSPWDGLELIIRDEDGRTITKGQDAELGPHFILFQKYQTNLIVEDL